MATTRSNVFSASTLIAVALAGPVAVTVVQSASGAAPAVTVAVHQQALHPQPQPHAAPGATPGSWRLAAD